ncbi:lipocalin family protein [Mangrovibacterium lignilyticum]|uniref:lipocalin family protein n=1 Tax=Mangrovibacterium lignilyticum TaxID=2668052 RepID=UPI0013D6ADAC|nr:lipocalin family protein [Mangrovibacterium lignilyticum]
MFRKFAYSISILILLFSCSEKPTIDTRTVSSVDLNKYMGTWYEIARFQHSFEKDLVGVTANYKLRDDGKIRVLNSGWKGTFEGEFDAARGVAKIPDPAEPGKLKVSFFLFFYSDYYILELDTTNYEYALIGSSTPDYLWILGNSPQMDPAIYKMLVDKAAERGYDVSKLYKVPQPQL